MMPRKSDPHLTSPKIRERENRRLSDCYQGLAAAS